VIPAFVLGVVGDRKWCVAGGYAACPALATDIDLWVYGIDHRNLENERNILRSLLMHRVDELNEGRPKWAEKRYGYVREEGQETTVVYEQESHLIEKVGVVTCPRVAFVNDENLHATDARTKPIHIMVTTAADPGSLISGFDISTHAVALDYSGRVWKHNLFTGPHEKPAVLRVNPNTQNRLDRICKRFGHKPFVVEYATNTTDDDIPF
jgi:hypothetical protein